MLRKATILTILFVLSIHLSSCQGTTTKEIPVAASQPSITPMPSPQPGKDGNLSVLNITSGTPIPSIQPDNIQNGNMERKTPLLSESMDSLEPKILKVTGMEDESNNDRFFIYPEDEFGNAFQFSGMPDDYPLPFVAFTADTFYLLAANKSCTDVMLVYRLDNFSVNPAKTFITHDEDILYISSQAPWREATVTTTYQWDGGKLVETGVEDSDSTQDYYDRMKQHVTEENLDALRKEYTRENLPPYFASYQDYFELPARVLRLANKKALEMYGDKATAVEIMEYGLDCYESVWRWTTDGNWKEGLKAITREQLQEDRSLCLPEAEFVQILKNYVDLLYDAGQNTDLEALLLKITELNHSMNEAYIENLEEHGVFFNIADFGLDSISSSYFYWSPQGGSIFFLGSKRSDEGDFTSGVYVLNPSSGELETIIEGLSGLLHLPNPSWSEDQSMIVFSLYHQNEKDHPIYLYQTETKTVQKLPVSGYSPVLSCDSKKIAYSKADGSIGTYTLSDGEAAYLPEKIKGFNPLWLSDNQRILLFKSTGENPHGLDGGELHGICMVDTHSPASIEDLGYKKVYRSMEWIVQDQLVAVYSGWDDGYCFELLNVNTGELRELGLGDDYSYQTGEKTYIIQSSDDSFKVLDSGLNVTGASFPAQEGAINHFLSLDINGKVVYLSEDPNSGYSAVMLSDRYNKTNKQMTEYTQYGFPVVSDDGRMVALFSKDEKSFVTFESYDLANRPLFSPNTMITHENGLEIIKNAFKPSGADIEIQYNGISKKASQFYYQYTVKQKTGSGKHTDYFVDIQTGAALKADFLRE